MRDRPDHPRQLGHLRLVRELPDSNVGRRWIGLHEHRRTNHLVYRLPGRRDRGERRDVLSLLERISAIRHPHLLPIEQYTLGSDGSAWIVAPYTGNQAGLVTLNDVLEAKGGKMPSFEAERTIEHLLSGVALAHEHGVIHGPVIEDELLVDRHGSLLVELYGLRVGLEGQTEHSPELARDEIRAVVQTGYRLVTGLAPEEPIIPASRVVKRLERRWDAWFERGLDPTDGFDSANAAMDALRSGELAPEAPVIRAKSVLGRLGWAGLGSKRQDR
jgi:serine/threonine protein kinase